MRLGDQSGRDEGRIGSVVRKVNAVGEFTGTHAYPQLVPRLVGWTTRCRAEGLLAAVVDDPRDLPSQIDAMNDAVDKAVLQHELGRLESLG